MKKKVLVVEDSFTVRQDIALALQEAGFEVISAVDGLEGELKTRSTEDLALVVTDINMPRMTGLEMVAKLKRDPKHAALPIIVLTTEGRPDLIQQAKRDGAKGWMVKPFKPELLVALVRKLAL